MRIDLRGAQFIVVLITTSHRQGLLPVTGMWIRSIAEVMMAAFDDKTQGESSKCAP